MGTKPSESVEAKEVIVRGEVLRQLYNGILWWRPCLGYLHIFFKQILLTRELWQAQIVWFGGFFILLHNHLAIWTKALWLFFASPWIFIQIKTFSSCQHWGLTHWPLDYKACALPLQHWDSLRISTFAKRLI